jgi:hypothetical protein
MEPLRRNIVRGKDASLKCFILISFRVTITSSIELLGFNYILNLGEEKRGKVNVNPSTLTWKTRRFASKNIPASRELHPANPAGYFIAASLQD